MIKRVSVLILGVIMVFSFASSSQASSTKWNLYGSSTNCTNCMYVTSQGTIDLNPITQTVKFKGWASTIWAGGWADKIEMKIYAKTYVTYVNNISTSSNIHEDTHTFQNGTNQTNLSVTIDDTYSSFGLWNARVQTSGWVKFDEGANYFSATGSGSDGL